MAVNSKALIITTIATTITMPGSQMASLVREQRKEPACSRCMYDYVCMRDETCQGATESSGVAKR